MCCGDLITRLPPLIFTPLNSMKLILSQITGKALIFAALALVPAEAQLAGQLGVLDLTANDGINPATGAAWAEGDTYRLILLSSTTTTALSPDITTYNTFVQETVAASTAFPSLGDSTWNMLGSTLTVDARDNTGTNPDVEIGVPVFLMDGTSLLANNNAEVWRVPSVVPVIFDENGVATSNPGGRVFTGSFNNGTGVGPGGGGGADGDGMGAGDTALGVLDGQGVQTGSPVGTLAGRETDFWIRQWKEPAANALPVYAISEPLTVIVASATGLVITDIAYDADTNTVSLTWNSAPDRSYIVKYSIDMIDWEFDLDDGVLGDAGESTTRTYDLSDIPELNGVTTTFFRIEE